MHAMSRLAAILLLLVACKSKAAPGVKCEKPNAAVCQDNTTALLCRDGTWDSIPCRGSAGCRQTDQGSKELKCDDSLASEGEGCILADHHACSTDQKRALVCKDKKFQLWLHCRGAKGCTSTGNMVTCDSSLSESGDPCNTPGGFGCSTDHKVLMICRDGKWGAVSSCRGPDGCKFTEAQRAICDDTVAMEGDPCDTPGERTCSVDKKAELECRDKKYVKKRDCKRKDGCLYRPGIELLCD